MDYLKVNKESWNKRLETHLNSEFYAMDTFMAGACSLNSIELHLRKMQKLLDDQFKTSAEKKKLSKLFREVLKYRPSELVKKSDPPFPRRLRKVES